MAEENNHHVRHLTTSDKLLAFSHNGIVGECGTGVFTLEKMGMMALFRLLNRNHFTESLN